MSQNVKYITASIITIVVALSFYSGCYLPIRKSQIYISGYKGINTVRSLQEFNALMDPALNFYSPVGQDEIVSYYLGTIADFLIPRQNEAPNREIADALVSQAEKWGLPIIESRRGFLLSQNAYKMGLIYKYAATSLKDENYLNKAINMFEQGLEFSPNRAPMLYNIFELYYIKNDRDGMKEIGERILTLWPNDGQIRNIIESLGQ